MMSCFAAMIACYCLMELDPRLFDKIEEEPIPEAGKGAHNTDYSLYSMKTPAKHLNSICFRKGELCPKAERLMTRKR